ncbi:MAG TPA: RraA family protein [Candidatus Dormibacteraeota bacterium]|nr:RraA family protein [Candidatus Dormibacteraeota bacterium]
MTEAAAGARLARHSTSTLSDALDRLGIPGQALGISPLDRRFRLAGPAFTVRTIPVALGASPGTVGDYIDEVPPGSVLVLDNGGRMDGTVWGDILTVTAHRNQLAGTVIHGVCRDASRSLELGYPIFSRGVTMRTGRGRVQADGVNVPVSLGDVRVQPGDLLIGDGDGVVVVPADRVEDVIHVADDISAAEDSIREEIRGGSRLDEARKRHRYFHLSAKTP